uniref:ANK_REP_REGION domain-containing protein n=1 Tax=Heterorhabditis bacteriophora TaxID=37862 RepID=A0A1I7X9H2_HETBA
MSVESKTSETTAIIRNFTRNDSGDATVSLHSFVDNDAKLREKQFLLSCERGDIGSVRKLLCQREGLNINCVDPLGR